MWFTLWEELLFGANHFLFMFKVGLDPVFLYGPVSPVVLAAEQQTFGFLEEDEKESANFQ